MSRLFLILVKKFGYEAARRMAPQYGISQRVVNKTARQINRRFMDAKFGDDLNYLMSSPQSAAINRAGGIRQLKEMGRRGLRRTGPPQGPGRGLRDMEALADYRMNIQPLMRQMGGRGVSTGDKNIDRIVKSVKRHKKKPAKTFPERKAGRELQEPLYYKRRAERLNRLMNDPRHKIGRRETHDERLERLIDEFYAQ